MKHLDIVQNKDGKVALATKVKSYRAITGNEVFSCSLYFLNPKDRLTGKIAWYSDDELTVLGNAVDMWDEHGSNQ